MGLFQGSFLAKYLSLLSFLALFVAGFQLLGRDWTSAVVSLFGSIALSYVGYRLAGGRANPSLYEKLDLFEILRLHASSWPRGKIRIGFHILRDQRSLLSRLESVGKMNTGRKSDRQFIRDATFRDRDAFDAVREEMVIKTTHDGRAQHWDGFGQTRKEDWFREAEIILDVDASLAELIGRACERERARRQR